MKRVVPASKFEETVPVTTCNPSKLIAVCEGFMGIVEFKREEGTTQYRVYWNNGNASEWFNSISLMLEGTKDTNIKIYQL